QTEQTNDVDGHNDAQDSELTNSDDEENPSFTMKAYKEKEQDEEVSALETKVFKFNQTSQFAEAVSSILGIVDNYLASKLKEEVNVAIFKRISIMHWLKRTTRTRTSLPHMVMLLHWKEDKMIKTRIKTRLLDQTKGRKEESQARMMNHQKAQSQRNQSHLALPKAPNLSINLLLKEEVNVAVRLKSNKLKEEAEAENQEFINQVYLTMKKIIKEQEKAQVSKIMSQIENNSFERKNSGDSDGGLIIGGGMGIGKGVEVA
nr:hypothetical protein [Tanacetum cinerariifolium]